MTNNTNLIARLAKAIEATNKTIAAHTRLLRSGTLSPAEEKAVEDARNIAIGMLTAYNITQEELIAQDQGY